MSSAIVAPTIRQYSNEEATPILGLADFWLDMSDSSKFTTSSTTRISTLTDKSSTPKTITPTGNISYDTLRKGIKPSGTAGTDYLTVNLASPPTATTANETVFIVGYLFNTGTSAFLGGTATGTRSIYANSTGILYGRYGSGNVTATVTVPTETVFVACAQLTTSTNVNLFYNGRFITSGSPGGFTASSATQNIFRAGGVTTYWTRGAVYEMLIFSSALTTTQVNTVNYYLMNKWKVVTSTTSLISSPLSITGTPCTLWLDGNDSSTITYSSGTSVSQWADKSGNGYHATQPTGINQPTYDSTLKGVKFTATSSTAFNTTCPFSPTETVFIVANIAVSSGNDCILGSSNSSNGRYFRIHSTGGLFASNATSLYTPNYNSISTADKHIISWTNDGTTGFFEAGYDTTQDYDSTTAFTYAAGSFTNVIGATRSTYAAPYNTYIYEVIIFNSAVSVANRLSICQYLTNKWNITNNAPLTNSYLYPFYNSRPFTRPFTPLDIDGCVLWLDASDQGSFTLSGSNLSTITDKSGTGKTITISATPPTWTSTGFNTSYACFTFTSSTQLTTTLSSAIGTGDCMFIVVMKNTGTNAQNNVLTVGVPAGGTEMGMGWNNGQAGYKFYQYASGEGITSGVANSTEIISIGTRTGSTMAITVNGTTATSTGTASTNNTNTAVYIGSTSTFAYVGQICEVILFIGTTSTTQRQQLEIYLSQKWGLIGSTPSTHPAKLYRALTNAFDPRQIGALALWLDASDITTITPGTIGSSVTRWNDKSGNNLSALIGNYTLPTYNVSTDGKPYVNFGVNQSMFVANFPYNVTWNVFVAMNTTTLAGRWFISPYDTLSLVMMGFNNNKIFDMLGTQTDLSGEHIENTSAVNTNGTASYFWFRDGTQGATASVARAIAATTLSLGIGANGRNADPLVGSGSVIRAYEIIIYCGATTTLLSTTQRQRIEGYLAHKWGLQSGLPSSHPYKKIRP